MADKIQSRRGLAADWTAANPVLSAGEWGKETDTGLFKTGDGTTAWNALPYSAVLPSDPRLSGSTATTSGIVELATDAEAIAGVDTARAITPANLAPLIGESQHRRAGYLNVLGTTVTPGVPQEFNLTDLLEGAGDENLFYNPTFKIWPHGYTSVSIPAEGDNFGPGGWIGANHTGPASVDSLIHPQKGGWQSVLSYTTSTQFHYFRQLVPNVSSFSRGIYTITVDVEFSAAMQVDFYVQARVNAADLERELVLDSPFLAVTAGRKIIAVAFQVPDLWDNTNIWDDRSMMEVAFRAVSTASGTRTVKVYGMALTPGRYARRPGPSIPALDNAAIESYYETGYVNVGGLTATSGQKKAQAQFRTRKALPVAASDIIVSDLAGTAGVISTYDIAGTRTDGVAYTALQGDTVTGDSYRNGFTIVKNSSAACGIAFTWKCDNY